jgi:hypothetical protein
MAKILKTSPSGRKCLFPNCTQTLSIYNHESYCHVHLNRGQAPQTQKPKTLTPPDVLIGTM